MRGRAQLCVTGSLPSGTGRTLGPLLQPARALGFGPSPGAAVAPGARWGPPGQGWDHVCVPPQSQQPPPPVQHLPKPRGEATLKMRASVRMTRYLESWGAARPFAHLSHRESLSSGGTPVPPGRRPKVGPAGGGACGGRTHPAGQPRPSVLGGAGGVQACGARSRGLRWPRPPRPPDWVRSGSGSLQLGQRPAPSRSGQR